MWLNLKTNIHVLHYLQKLQMTLQIYHFGSKNTVTLTLVQLRNFRKNDEGIYQL